MTVKSGAEDEVDPELRALGHRAPDDRERDAREDDLEHVAGGPRDGREERVRRLADREQRVDGRREAARAEDRVAVAERDPEADRPVDERADAEDEDVLAGDVRGVLHPRQARLEEREAGLHEHHEDRRDDDPDGVRGDQEVGVAHAASSSGFPVRLCVTCSTRVVQTSPSPQSLPGAGRVGDRRGHGLRERVLDDEGQERLRQEARLEDAPAVLVRDPALASVPDRLDDGHADVAGLLLDRVDHDLDALPQDDRFDLRHEITSLRRSTRTVSRQMPCRRPIRSRLPTSRKPKRRSSRRLASFSGKTLVCSVQIPTSLGALDRGREQLASHALRARFLAHVRADLGRRRSSTTRRDRQKRDPARRPARRARRRSGALRGATRPTPPRTAPRSRRSRCPSRSPRGRCARPPASHPARRSRTTTPSPTPRTRPRSAPAR